MSCRSLSSRLTKSSLVRALPFRKLTKRRRLLEIGVVSFWHGGNESVVSLQATERPSAGNRPLSQWLQGRKQSTSVKLNQIRLKAMPLYVVQVSGVDGYERVSGC